MERMYYTRNYGDIHYTATPTGADGEHSTEAIPMYDGPRNCPGTVTFTGFRLLDVGERWQVPAHWPDTHPQVVAFLDSHGFKARHAEIVAANRW